MLKNHFPSTIFGLGSSKSTYSNLPSRYKIRKSIESTIDKGSYTWQLARVDINGKIEFDAK